MKKTALVGALLLSSFAYAAPSYYVYGGIGYSKADTDLGWVEQNVQTEIWDATATYSGDVDEKSVGAKLAFGYRLNDYFAIEGAYTYLGKAKASADARLETPGIDGAGNVVDFANGKASMTGHVLSVDALAIYPVTDRIEVFVKGGVGVARVKTKLSGSEGYYNAEGVLADCESYSMSDSKTRFVPKLGIGAEWNVTDKIAIRTEYERLFGVSKESDYAVDADYDFVSIGLKYKF